MKKKFVFLLSVILLIFCFTGMVSATTYYVAASGCSDSNNGTSTISPWCTISKVNGITFQPGDIIKFQTDAVWTGTQLTIGNSGNSSDPITYTSYGSGSKPIFVNNPAYLTYSDSIRINGDWIVIDNLSTQNSSQSGVYVNAGADNNIIRNCEFYNLGEAVVMKGNNNLVTRNYVHDLKMIVNTAGGNDDYGATGSFIYNSSNEYSYNVMINCKAPSYDYGYDGGCFEPYAQHNITNISIHHNWCEDSNGFFEIGGANANFTTSNVTFAYNVLLNSQTIALHNAGVFSIRLINIRLLSNTIVDINSSHDVYGFIGSNAATNLNGTDFTLRNNIIVLNNYQHISNYKFNHSDNVWYLMNATTQWATGDGLSTNEVNANPKFVDMYGENFSLLPDSPARNTGVNLSLWFATDFANLTVPQEGVYDKGAYEYPENVSCSSNTYYIDYASGNDANNGTCTNSAWKHAPGDPNAAGIPASTTIVAGKKIIFKGGIAYEGTVNISSTRYQNGNSTDQIILRSGDRDTTAWGTGRAVIDGNNTRGDGFYITDGRSFVTIDGFEIMNISNDTSSAGIAVQYGSSSNILISHNLIHHIHGQSGNGGYGIDTGGLNKNIVIEFNEVYFCQEKGISIYATSNTTIRYNYVHQTTDHNIVVSGANNSIYGNILTQAGYDWGDGAGTDPAFSFKVDSGSTPGYDYADYNNVYNNIIWDTKVGMGILNGKYNNFSNNVVYYVGFDDLYSSSGGNKGFMLYNDSTSTNTVTGNIIANNIFYYVNPWLGNGYSVGLCIWNQSVLVNNTIKNNIFYYDSSHTDNWIRFSASGDGTPYTYYNISWLESPSGFASVGSGNIASGNVVADPKFVGGTGATFNVLLAPTWFDSQGHPNNSGFNLTASSPAIDAGLDMGSPFNVDVEGVSRPQGAAWDIGAYEYVPFDYSYPVFSNYWDNNASLTESGVGRFNVTITNTNGTVLLTFNNVNYTASNSSGNTTTFNATVPSISAGTYNYYWVSYGNGTNHNLNTSIMRSYTVNATADIISPVVSLVSPANASTWTSSSTVTFAYNVTDANSIANCSLIINRVLDQTATSVTKNTSQTFTKSMSNANYNWSVNCTDAAGNQGNSSTYALTVSYTAPAAPSGGGGGGGGGGSSVSNQTTTNQTTNATQNANNTGSQSTPENITTTSEKGIIAKIKEIFNEVGNWWNESKSVLKYYLLGVCAGSFLLGIFIIIRKIVKRKKEKRGSKELGAIKKRIKLKIERERREEEQRKKILEKIRRRRIK